MLGAEMPFNTTMGLVSPADWWVRRDLVPMPLRSGQHIDSARILKISMLRNDRSAGERMRMLIAVFVLLVQPWTIWAQSNSPSPAHSTNSGAAPASEKPAEEITSREETTTFRVNVNLVQVRVVVRDPGGRAIGDLSKDDFELLDNRKPQTIQQFAVEQGGAQGALAHPHHETSTGEEAPATGPADVGENYIAYLFDDVHLDFGDLARVREAAERHLASLRPTDRAAIFTTSGQTEVEFTEDRAKLHDGLMRLQPRPISRVASNSSCFDISYYMADEIQNKHDLHATEVATQDALICNYNGDKKYLNAAQGLVEMTSMAKLEAGRQESHVALTVVNDVIRRMSAIPGQRRVVIVSPGFLTPEMEAEYIAAVDHAVRSQVVINALDARGLYVITPGADASGVAPTALSQGMKQEYATLEATANAEVLAILAEETGGTFFQNSNDLDEGFRRTADTPEYSYLLAFSPQNLKLDGGFHTIRVKVKKPGKYTLQARQGYFAPKHLADPGQQAKEEIEEALFSQEEVHNLPVQLHTQFFKASEVEAKLSVLAHIDVKHLALKKLDGRNCDEVTVVSALFNANGGLLQGIQKTVTMRIKDETLEKRLGSGITVKTNFDVKPGNYLVRLVVRDAQAQTVSAESDAVRIP